MEFDIDKLDRSAPFTVPEGFFDTTRRDIEQSIARERKRTRRMHLLRWSMGAAAALAVAVTASIALHNTQPAVPPHGQNTLLASNNQQQVATAESIATPQGSKEITQATQPVENLESYLTDDELDECIAINDVDEFLHCQELLETL